MSEDSRVNNWDNGKYRCLLRIFIYDIGVDEQTYQLTEESRVHRWPFKIEYALFLKVWRDT